MNELIGLVAQKTGISDEQARKAVETVLGFVKTRLPAPIAKQVEGAIEGGGGGGMMGKAASKMGDMLGGEQRK